MKVSRRLALTVLIIAAGFSTALAWSAHVGRKVWSPRVFGWRNPLMPEPAVAGQPGCPLRIEGMRFYSFKSLLSSVGSVMKFDVKNVSGKAVHSFSLSHHSPDPLDAGSVGVQPERPLRPGEAQDTSLSARGRDRITLAIDFVQFADGSTWYADPPRETVKPEGVRAGAEASLAFLRRILDAKGAAAVMDELPRIHADVMEPDFSTTGAYGIFGFYSGVTNTVVRVEQAHRERGLSGAETLLRRDR
ncbi:MAG TPA: hypothetical protein VM864_13355 [Pyrinomonadaceae bacterium]|jgi:hypothetical protein|nr:hypothetical protein [Pyrinomonadaceae bacterium]